MTDSYPIKIWSGLLLDGHTRKIENALWEFIWLINKVTKEEGGIGMVLRGKPIKVEQIAEDLQRDYRTILRHLKRLEEYGYINLKRCPYGFVIKINNSKKFKNRYGKIVQSGKSECTKMSDGYDRIVHSGYDKNVQNKEDIKHIYKTDNKYTYCREEVKIIISYLNEKTEKNFKDATKKTQELIKARFSEGFTLDDFKKVIDIKATKWRKDPKMNLYLRPETLFGVKFESYLNEKIIENETIIYEGPKYKKI